MQQTCDAIFEKGVLRPLTNLQLNEGQSVKLIIEEKPTLEAEEMLKMAFQTHEGLSEKEIKEIEEIAGDRKHFYPLNYPLIRMFKSNRRKGSFPKIISNLLPCFLFILGRNWERKMQRFIQFKPIKIKGRF